VRVTSTILIPGATFQAPVNWAALSEASRRVGTTARVQADLRSGVPGDARVRLEAMDATYTFDAFLADARRDQGGALDVVEPTAATRVGGQPATAIGYRERAGAATIHKRVYVVSVTGGSVYRLTLEAPESAWAVRQPAMIDAVATVRFTGAAEAPSAPSSARVPSPTGTGPSATRGAAATSATLPPAPVPAAGAASTGGRPDPGPASGSTGICDDVSGPWTLTVATLGTSTWTLRPLGRDSYGASEQGLGNAGGTARLDRSGARPRLIIDWTIGTSLAGSYDLTLNARCTGGSGLLSFTRGRADQLTTQVVATPRGPVEGGRPADCRTADLSGRWRQETPGVGSSEWTLTRQPDGSYWGQEDGLGRASGPWRWRPDGLRLDWESADRVFAGWVTFSTFAADCGSASGNGQFTRGRGDPATTGLVRVSEPAPPAEGPAAPAGGSTPAGGTRSAADETFAVPQVNGADIDICVTRGRSCGQGGADNFCRAQGYARASHWSQVSSPRTLILGTSGDECRAPDGCGALRNVTCVR
jgi:hypothetical protein